MPEDTHTVEIGLGLVVYGGNHICGRGGGAPATPNDTLSLEIVKSYPCSYEHGYDLLNKLLHPQKMIFTRCVSSGIAGAPPPRPQM